MTSLYYCILFEHLFIDYLHNEYPVLDVDLTMVKGGRKFTPTLMRQNTPARQQLEMLKAISVEEIEKTQDKVNEHLLSTSAREKKDEEDVE